MERLINLRKLTQFLGLGLIAGEMKYDAAKKLFFPDPIYYHSIFSPTCVVYELDQIL